MNKNDYPSLFVSADTLSIKEQSKHLCFFKLHVALLLFGAILAINPLPSWLYSLFNAGIFLLALAISVLMASRRYERSWYSTRAVAESVKTATWRFMMQVEPYSYESDEIPAENKFCRLLERVLESNSHARELLIGESFDNTQITDFMNNTRARNMEERKALYSEFRIDEQLGWYTAKAEYNNRKEKQFHILLVISQCIAVGLVLVRIAFFEWFVWPTEVFVVAAGSITAWVQLKRYQEHGAAYALTANEIGTIRGNIEEVDTQEHFSAFVRDTENAFSREHTQWVVKADR